MRNIFTAYAPDYHDFDEVLRNLSLTTDGPEKWGFEEIGLCEEGYLGLFWLTNSTEFPLDEYALEDMRDKCYQKLKDYNNMPPSVRVTDDLYVVPHRSPQGWEWDAILIRDLETTVINTNISPYMAILAAVEFRKEELLKKACKVHEDAMALWNEELENSQ